MTATPTTSTHQLDLPGQTHVAEGPHDHTGMYVMHHAFRRDLAAFASSVRATPLRDADTWAALAHRWGRFAVTLHHHHEAEDVAYWPALLRATEERGSEADRAEVRAMSEEHAGIDPLLHTCAEGFSAVLGHPCEEHRNALDIRIAGLREVLGAHLEHEERVVLPLVQRVMTAEEYAAVDKAVARHYPTREVAFLIGWAMYGLPPEGQRRMIALAGAPYKVLHALLRGRFERGEQRAFRYGGGGTP